MNIIFIKPIGKSLTGSLKRHNNKGSLPAGGQGGKYENPHESVWARYVPLAQKRRIRGHFMPKRQRIENIFDWS